MTLDEAIAEAKRHLDNLPLNVSKVKVQLKVEVDLSDMSGTKYLWAVKSETNTFTH